MKYRTLETTIKLMNEAYSRFRDVSAMPRDPVALGHRPDAKERYHSVIARLSHKNSISDTEAALLKILKQKASEIEDTGSTTTSLRTQNVNNINNNMFVQRQLHRARKQQNVKRKIDEDVASADRVRKVIARVVRLANGALETRKQKRKWPARRILVQRKKQEEI